MNSNRERKRILLVEDDEMAQEIVAFALEEYTLICADSFDKGLRAVRQGYFDLYILDNWLPDGNGAELCRIIREFDPDTPINRSTWSYQGARSSYRIGQSDPCPSLALASKSMGESR